MLSPSGDANHEALLIHIVCVPWFNLVLSNFSQRETKSELVFDVGISVVTIGVHTR